MVELHGKRVRIWAYRRDGDIHVEITSILDPAY
jgi:hypothetical protein